MPFKIETDGMNNRLVLGDEPFQCVIYSKSGSGKGLLGESIIEKMHNKGWQIIILADPKGEIEHGFAMFEPKAHYHLNGLRKQGKKPSTKKVKIYHPFTFRIPNRKLPEINFYTLSLKDLGRAEWGMIVETFYDSDTIKIMMDTCQSIRSYDDVFSFIHRIRNSIKGKKKEGQVYYDPENFFVDVTSGKITSLQDIVNYLKIFKNDWVLSSDDCPLKLNIKEMLRDQEHYHFFTSRFILDEKIRDFMVLAIINQIILNRDYIKYPILIVIPEIRKLTPFRPEGYKKFLAHGLKDYLTTIRSIGRGFSSVADSQTYSLVDV